MQLYIWPFSTRCRFSVLEGKCFNRLREGVNFQLVFKSEIIRGRRVPDSQGLQHSAERKPLSSFIACRNSQSATLQPGLTASSLRGEAPKWNSNADERRAVQRLLFGGKLDRAKSKYCTALWLPQEAASTARASMSFRFYAVKRGRRTGVFDTLQDVQAQVDGLPASKVLYRGFCPRAPVIHSL